MGIIPLTNHYSSEVAWFVRDEIYPDPPTPAFAKAGAAPGTTAGVDLVLFQTLQTLTLKQLPQQAPQGQGHFPNRHPRARSQQWLSMGFQSCRLPARTRSATLQTLQMLPKPAKPSKHRPQQALPQQAPQGQGHFPNRHPRARPQQWLSMGFQSCRLPARKRSETLQTLQMLPKPAKPSKHRPQIHSNDLLKFSKLPFASLQRLQPHLPQQAPQGQGHFPNRHPRAKATSRTGTPRPGHSNGFLWAFKAAVCQPANAPKLSKPSKCSQNPPNPPNTVLPTGTPGPRPLPQQAPQGQATAMAFYGLSKLPFASPQTLRNSPNPPNAPKTRQTLQTPSSQQAPQGQGHFPNRHPRARPQQWLSMGFQSCHLPARKRSETLQTLQMLPKPAKPSKHRPQQALPQQAPQGQGHFPNRHPRARSQQWLSMGFQSCRLPARTRSATLQTLQMLPKPAKPSKHRPQQALPQQAPQGQGHFPNRHPRARPQQWLSMGFQSCRLPARKRSETLQTLQMLPKPAKPSKHRPQIHSNDLLKFSKLPFASLQRLQPHLPQQAPQGQGHFPNRHPRAKATSRTGTPRPGHSNGFLWAFKAAVCQPANAPKLSKPSKCSQNPPNPPNTVLPTGTPGPRPLPQQAPQGQGHFPNRHPKARPQQWLSMGFQSCRLPARKRSETLQTLQMLPKPAKPSKHRPPNKHPRAKATSPTGTPGPGHSNGFLWAFKAAIYQPANAPKLSKRSKCSQNPPNPPNTVRSRPFPNRHPRAKATSPTGTPGPGHSNGFLWAFKADVCQPANAPKLSKRSKCSQNPPNPPNTVRSRPSRSTAMTFVRLSKLPFASPQTLRNSPNAPNAPKTRQTLQTPSPDPQQ